MARRNRGAGPLMIANLVFQRSVGCKASCFQAFKRGRVHGLHTHLFAFPFVSVLSKADDQEAAILAPPIS